MRFIDDSADAYFLDLPRIAYIKFSIFRFFDSMLNYTV